MDVDIAGSSLLGTTDDTSLPDPLLVTDGSQKSMAFSRASSYSFGDEDISQIIANLPPTQQVAENPPRSASSSEKSLGKRKATETSTSDISAASSSQDGSRPAKMPRTDIIRDDADNPFLDTDVKMKDKEEDRYAPICCSPPYMLQRALVAKKLPYCVHYEIARYVSLGKISFSEITLPNLDTLASRTNEKAAPDTLKTIMNSQFIEEGEREREKEDQFKGLFAKEHAAKSPWRELDKEEAARAEDPYGGLGFDEKGEIRDYHGQVLFHGKLQDKSKNCKKPNTQPAYKIILESATLGPSNMFSRRFGSQHFFRLKLTKQVLNKNQDALEEHLKRPLLLCGSVFRAFYAKDSNAFYVKTNEVTDGMKILPNETVPGVLSFLEFLKWHNDERLNIKQKMAKYVSRFALGLSNSVPGLLVDQSNIRFIDDITSEAGSNMTDGAGKINRWSLRQIRHRLEWEDKPTAIQTRIFGTKGLLVDDGKNADEFAYVELTPSQQKIQFPSSVDIDPAHRIIDVLRASHTKAPCRLSVETIVCLADRGVPKEAFMELLRQSLAELIEPLLDWTTPDAMRELWCNVRRLGGVMGARRAREEAGLARVKGYSEREGEDVELDDEDGIATFDLTEQASRSSAWWGDEVSGCPSSLEETIMCMLDSNFTPQENLILRDKLQKFIKARVKDYIRSYRIDVPMSASAFLIPDTEGILEEGEVFFKSSRRQFKNTDGTETDVYTGDVLVTRNPCKLPTDIQKWKSVDKPGLHHLVDVIVCSTKGDRRAADWLAGGDYDGDTGKYIYQPELVDKFKNAPPRLGDPPADIENYFSRKNEEVEAFLKRTESLSLEEQIRERQKVLLGAVLAAPVGQYSNFHEIATYTLGYSHPETLRLAHMFCMTLDGVKTGKTVAPETFKRDKAKYDKIPPQWKELSDEDKERNEQRNELAVKRPRKLGKFIMDSLYSLAEKQGTEWLTRIEEHFEQAPRTSLDQQLAAPWNEALDMSKTWQTAENNDRMSRDLEVIRAHVIKCYEKHRNEMLSTPRKPGKASPSKSSSGASFTELPIEVRQDKFRRLSKEFASFPLPGNVLMSQKEIARLRASYAYIYDFEQRRSHGSNNFTRFPFDVSMRELCAIKAGASGRHKTVSGDFYDHFNIKHPKKHHI